MGVLLIVDITGDRITVHAQTTGTQKPNILLIMGADIGWMQPGIYHRGLMVGRTPNIDRIGHEVGIFMDYVAMQSRTSGRNGFFTSMLELYAGLADAIVGRRLPPPCQLGGDYVAPRPRWMQQIARNATGELGITGSAAVHIV